MELQNTSSERRHWTSLQTADGRTLVLDPGEVGDVAVDKAPADPWLRPARGGGAAKGKNPSGKAGNSRTGQQNVPESPSSGGSPPEPPTDEPAEADASGKEA